LLYLFTTTYIQTREYLKANYGVLLQQNYLWGMSFTFDPKKTLKYLIKFQKLLDPAKPASSPPWYGNPFSNYLHRLWRCPRMGNQ